MEIKIEVINDGDAVLAIIGDIPTGLCGMGHSVSSALADLAAEVKMYETQTKPHYKAADQQLLDQIGGLNLIANKGETR